MSEYDEVESVVDEELEACLVHMDDISKRSALSRWWKHLCGIAWLVFVIFQAFIGIDHTYSPHPLCRHSYKSHGKWAWYTTFACFGGFALIFSAVAWKLWTCDRASKRVPLWVALNIVFMGTLSTLFALFEWGGICIDVLGVASPASIWGEWMSDGPLLIFITITIVEKSNLTRMDWFLMGTFFVCLLAGFLIIPADHDWGVFWLVFSFLTYAPVLYLPWYDNHNSHSITPDLVEQNVKRFGERYAKRFNIAMGLTLVLPVFTVNYIAAMFGTIDAAQTIAVYQVLSVLTKGLFAAAVMDIHLDFLVAAERALVEERRANVARRVFMKYIFHEVRTPLNSLSMGIEFLSMSPNMSYQERECLMMMKSASQFMGTTLDDVLDLQKIEEGKFALDWGRMSIQSCVEKALAAFAAAATRKGVTLRHQIFADVPNGVKGDADRITHVISNLVGNAIKFSPEGEEVTVIVACDAMLSLPHGPTKAMVTICVEDRGVGIAPEDQAHIFHNFAQVRPGRLREGRGSGLGLSLCKEVVELHGGTISVSSQVQQEGEVRGRGSRFVIKIPFEIYETRSDESEDEDAVFSLNENRPPSPQLSNSQLSFNNSVGEGGDGAPHVSTASVDQTGDGALGSSSLRGVPSSELRVLVVDDVESSRKLLAMLLKRKGIANDCAVDGQQAVDVILAKPNVYQLVLMDNMMPIMNGVEATKRLRAEGYPFLIIGVTGNVMDDDVAEFLGAGADMVLAKPLKQATLNAIIAHIEQQGTGAYPGMKLTIA